MPHVLDKFHLRFAAVVQKEWGITEVCQFLPVALPKRPATLLPTWPHILV